MSEEVEIEVVNSIKQIPQESWDSVAGESIGLNYLMLQFMEDNYEGSEKARYFLVRTSDTVMAVSVAGVYADSEEDLLIQRIFGRLVASIRPVVRSLDRALVCGHIPGPGAAVITRSGLDQPHWINIICGAMENYASSQNLHMSYTGVLPEQTLLSHELSRRGYLQGIDNPVATMDVTWHDQESYLNVLKARKKKYAATARTEIRRFHKSGIRITHWTGNDSASLHELLRTHKEARNSAGFQFRPEFLDDLVSRLGKDCIVYVAHKGETLVGVMVAIRCNDKVRVWLEGIDRAAESTNSTYFNLVYYCPFSEFPSLGIRRVYLGNAVQYAKYRCGCDIIGARFFVRLGGALWH